MRLKLSLSIFGFALLLGATGCEESVRRPAQVRPAQISAPAVAPVELARLPLRAVSPQAPSLIPAPPSGVEILIARVEEAFQSGEQEYKAGHLVGARREFDRAVDGMLSSGYDLQADPRLDHLFDRIVETVYAHEMAAFREGDGFSEQKAEPAAIDEIAEMTFPPEKLDPRLTRRAEQEMRVLQHDLPLTVNDYVMSYLNFFQTPRGRTIVETGLKRSGRYRPMIARVLREEGLPQDLIFLAQAESAFQPLALSRAGARGIWQFMSYRGREYGLERSWWVDERQDPEKATRAAARHLRDLYGMFGDWYLAMAAYNSGPGNVQKAIERTGYADFWELYKRNVLPKETRNYVPIIIALTLMAKDASRYGLQTDAEAPLRFDAVKPGHAIDLRLVAESIDVDVDTLRLLNPELLRMVTPNNAEFELRLPEGAAQRFFAEVSGIPPEKWVSWRRYRVEEGETFFGIARKFRVTPEAIADANGRGGRTELHVGDKLIIPAAARPQPELGKLVRYRVRRGDALESIAEEFDVTAAQVKRWNGLHSSHVTRGMRLRIYPGGQPMPAARSRRKHKASRGSLTKSKPSPPKPSAAS